MHHDFPADAPVAAPLFYRSYSRRLPDGTRESWEQVVDRNIKGLTLVGNLDQHQVDLLRRHQLDLTALPSGRWLWVGGTDWVKRPANFYGGYNCSSRQLNDISVFGALMDMAMQGTGTGAVLTCDNVAKLPTVKNHITVKYDGDLGASPPERRSDATMTTVTNGVVTIRVGDSRQGWVRAYQQLIDLAFDGLVADGKATIMIDLRWVRPAGEPLKGFGGTANPAALGEMFSRVARVLNKAVGRQLRALECCLIIDEAARCVVAGNIRRSAGMRQFDRLDQEAAAAKQGLWTQTEDGQWVIDPDKDALRMANHTRVFFCKPTFEEVLESVKSQHASGEGALMFAPEAIARSNNDLLNAPWLKEQFLKSFEEGGQQGAMGFLCQILHGHTQINDLNDKDRLELEHRINRYGLNPCFAAGTMVMTREGHFPIEDLVGRVVEIHDGTSWVTIDNFRVTATDQPVFDVELHSGQVITATAYHKFILDDGRRVMLQDLRPGMRLAPQVARAPGMIEARSAYLKGFLIGDGTHDAKAGIPICKVYEPKLVCLSRLIASQKEIPMRQLTPANGRVVGDSFGLSNGGYLRNLNHEDGEWLLPWCSVYKKEFPMQVLNWTPQGQADFIAGLFDADGTAMDTTNGFAYQITSVSRSFLQGLGLLLTQMGVRWKIGPARKGGKKDFGPDRGGVYQVQDTYRLTISQAGSIRLSQLVRFERLKSFADRETAYAIKDRSLQVKSVTPAGIRDEVYCCTVPDSHAFTLTAGAVVAQCGEILGADFLCNLAEVHLNRLDPANEDEIDSAFKAAALSVSVLLHHVFRDPVMARSRQWDPIVGVSFTGLFDFFARAFGSKWLHWWADGRRPTFEGQRFQKEEEKYLRRWRQVVEAEVAAYCQSNGLRIPTRTTTVQPAGCLGEGAVRVFDQGLFTATDFAGGSGLAKALTKDLTVRRGIPIENWIANPEAPCLEVTLGSGRKIICTPDHRFMVDNSQRWVQARDLEIGSTLVSSLGRYARTEETALYRVIGGPASQPDTLNDGLAYLLGYLTSNNGTDQPGVVSCSVPATTQGTRLLERLQRQLELSFGSHVSIKRKGKGKQLELTGQVHRIEEWMTAQLFPTLSLSRCWEAVRELPLTVRRGSVHSILHFLAGMIDATSRQVHRTRAHIVLMNSVLADHLLQVMEAVGLGVRIKSYASASLLCIDPACSRSWALDVINTASVLLQDRPLNRVATSWSGKGRAEDLFKVVSVLNTAKEHATYDVTVAINDDDAWYYTGGLVSHNSKSLLTNASPGWHPPKAPYYIRRVTFGKNDPIALACMDYGYRVVPSQSDKDEKGWLLDDPFDPRCTEWLVEIPVATPWADQPGAENIQTDQFSALAQFDFYMGVQRAYTAHNTSATLTLTKEEIRPLAQAIHATIDADLGYISAALLARSDCKETFPRMPYESISRQEYERLSREVIERRREDDFAEALRKRDAEAQGISLEQAGPAGCDSDACTLPMKQPAGDDPLDH